MGQSSILGWHLAPSPLSYPSPSLCLPARLRGSQSLGNPSGRGEGCPVPGKRPVEGRHLTPPLLLPSTLYF